MLQRWINIRDTGWQVLVCTTPFGGRILARVHCKDSETSSICDGVVVHVSCWSWSFPYSARGRMNQQQYLKVLQKKLLSDWLWHFPQNDGIFQQDGAPCHTAKSVKAFLQRKKIPLLPWPGNSLDISPIENLWMIVKRRIAQRKPTSKTALIEALIDVWARDPEI